MKHKILMTLALLIAAVSGAWAQKQITITQDFENGLGDWTTNHCHPSSEISSAYTSHGGDNVFRFCYTENFPQYLISPEIDAAGGGTMSFYYARFSNGYLETFKVGYSTTTNDPTAFTWGNEVTCTNIHTSEYLEYTYDIPAGAKYVAIACTSNDKYYLFVDDIKIEYVDPADPNAVEVTTNKAEGETTFTEASFEMPTSDVDVDYELVRDMSISMTTTMGDGTDGVRYRVKKAQQGDGYEPADLNMMQVLALVAVNDGIEQKALTLNQDYYCRIYKLDEQTLQPIGDGVMLFDFDFAPGLYALKAFAQNGGDYAGETALSNTFKLFQGYEVEVAAKEFITYYKDEPLYADTETSADAVIYTISSVNDTQAVLSSAIETAPSKTPLLVYNNSDEAKTFLLIPADAEPNLSLDVYDGFIGTLTATTIAASDEDQTNYALNGKAFVYVKYAIPVAANKAWLNISNSNARVINIVFDETTGITNADRTKSTDDSWYTIDGRKVNAPTKKGVYILNGQKVVVK